MLDLLLAPLSYTGYLVIAPWAALFPAMALFALGWRFRSYVCHVAAGCWLLYAIFESLMYLRILCSGECNIRIDLVVIHPFLIAMTILAIVVVVFRRSKKKVA